MPVTQSCKRERTAPAATLNRILLLTFAVVFTLVAASCTKGGDGSTPQVPNGVAANPTAVNLGSTLDSTIVTLSGVGTSPPSITGVSTNAAWLSAAAANTDTDGLGTYTVSVDRTGQTAGDYSGTVTFALSDGNTVDVIVTMRVVITVGGTITAASNTAVDGDLNDPFSPLTANDSFATAQPLTTPVILNGFVTKFGTGFTGDRFATSGDESDFYRATLLNGQFVSLRVADYPQNPANDVDIYLYDSNQKVVTSSLLQQEFESMQVPADGDYYIEVYAYSGSSKYVLNIGSTSLASTSPSCSKPRSCGRSCR